MSRLLAEMPGLAQLVSPTSTSTTPPPSFPAIGVSPASLSFAATQGGASPANQTVTISNTGGGTLTWNASDNAAWLTVSPASGTGTGSVTVSVATGTLTAGTYNGTITLSATGATSVTVPVTFTITTSPVPPAIGVSPTSLTFTATQGGTSPANQTLTISNTGGGALAWNTSNNASWLTVTPASGNGNGVTTVSVSTGSLTSGTYNATITLSATGTATVTIPVTFNVAAASTLTASPTNLSFTATQGAANPSSQAVTVTSNGSWTVTKNASWLTITPASGTNNGSITVSVNTATAAVGTNSGTITVTGGGITRTVAVTLTLNAPSTSSATLAWDANPASDLAGYKVYRATASGAYGMPITTLQGNVTGYVATGLVSGTTYFFVVTAYDNAGNESSYSNEVSKSIF